MRRLLLVALVALIAAPAADASRYVRFGVQDDAWLAAGPGDFWGRLAELDRMGVEVYRFTLRWDRVAKQKPANGRDPSDPAYNWEFADAVVRGLRAHGITPMLTIWGTPRWASGGRSANWAPRSKWSLAAFAHAAAKRYRSEVHHWTIWNEPNKARWFRPVSARTYTKLLNVSYAAIKSADRRDKVAGGVTGPRASGGISPVDFIRAMDRHRAKLDAYAHNPYPSSRRETPWRGGCAWCETITMANLERLIREVRRAFGPKRIWLTEYGYQTNPPDRWLGVSYATQARYVGEAARRVYLAPYVDFLIHFMVLDDTKPGGWQSGFRTASGVKKPSHAAWRLPIAQASRTGVRTAVWGQVRDRTGRQPYRLQQFRNAAGGESAANDGRTGAGSIGAWCGRGAARSCGSSPSGTARTAWPSRCAKGSVLTCRCQLARAERRVTGSDAADRPGFAHGVFAPSGAAHAAGPPPLFSSD